MTTDEQRKRWAELAEKATPGPWVVVDDTAVMTKGGDGPGWGSYPQDVCEAGDGDTPFIAAAREAVPALLAENASLRDTIERLTAWGRSAEAVCNSEGIGPVLTLDEVLSGKNWDRSVDEALDTSAERG